LHEDENKDTKERKEKLSSGWENDQWTSLCRGRYNTVQGKANAGKAGYILIWQKCLSQVLGDHNVFEWSKREIGSSHDQGEERLSFARLGRLPLGGLVITTYWQFQNIYVFSLAGIGVPLANLLQLHLRRPGGRGMASTSLKLTRVSPHLLLLHSTTMIGKNKAEAEFYHHCTAPKPEQRQPGMMSFSQPYSSCILTIPHRARVISASMQAASARSSKD
jgi:hypothetical protein